MHRGGEQRIVHNGQCGNRCSSVSPSAFNESLVLKTLMCQECHSARHNCFLT